MVNKQNPDSSRNSIWDSWRKTRKGLYVYSHSLSQVSIVFVNKFRWNNDVSWEKGENFAQGEISSDSVRHYAC